MYDRDMALTSARDLAKARSEVVVHWEALQNTLDNLICSLISCASTAVLWSLGIKCRETHASHRIADVAWGLSLFHVQARRRTQPRCGSPISARAMWTRWRVPCATASAAKWASEGAFPCCCPQRSRAAAWCP